MAGIRATRRTATSTNVGIASTTSLEKTETQSSIETTLKYEGQDAEKAGAAPVVANMEEIALKALHIDDDPTLNPWTFRMFFLGIII
jgi:hypothetical protein